MYLLILKARQGVIAFEYVPIKKETERMYILEHTSKLMCLERIKKQNEGKFFYSYGETLLFTKVCVKSNISTVKKELKTILIEHEITTIDKKIQELNEIKLLYQKEADKL